VSPAAQRIVILDSFAIDQGEPDDFWGDLAALGALTVHEQSEGGEIVGRARDALAVLTNKVPLGAAELAALCPATSCVKCRMSANTSSATDSVA
jgi:hypothetical protein